MCKWDDMAKDADQSKMILDTYEIIPVGHLAGDAGSGLRDMLRHTRGRALKREDTKKRETGGMRGFIIRRAARLRAACLQH